MRTRDVTIPLALWICAAICAHFLFGTGGMVVAQVHDDRSELLRLSHAASTLAKRDDQTFEVSLGEPGEEPKEEAPPPPPPQPPKPKPPVVDKQLEPPKPPEREKKEEKKIVVVEKKAENKPLPDEPMKDRRIAVRQHAKADQEDNPTAKFIADEANHVDNETRATQTSHDRDDADPSPGAAHRSTEQAPGDSDTTRIADSEVHKGEKNRAPGERGTDFDVVHEPKIPKQELQPIRTTAAPTPPAQGGQRAAGTEAPPASPQSQPQPVLGGTAPAQALESGADGTWTFNPARPGGAPGSTSPPTAGASSPNAPSLPGGKMWSLPGLGQSATPGSLNTNLNQVQVVSIVGLDNMRKLREADGERRKSEHRGSWAASNFDRWRSAIENYASSVKPGNQTALNTARVPFASYLNGMHNRIHPIFADAFLESLDSLPPSHPMNDQHLVTRLEIVLTKEGHLRKMGIVKTSGLTAFDIAALDAIDRAQPFGPAPSAIVSPDGNVYLHWEFHRDEVFACSTQGAQPFILNAPGPTKKEETLPPAPPAGPAQERGSPPASPNDAREGWLERTPSQGKGAALAGWRSALSGGTSPYSRY